MTTATISTTTELLERASQREHLAPSEWLQLITEIPTEDLRQAADNLRRELHPDNAVTYVVDRNINYTNICFSVCNFCAF